MWSSCTAVAVVAVGLYFILEWHGTTKPVSLQTQRFLLLTLQQQQQKQQQQSSEDAFSLQLQDGPPSPKDTDDDFTRDEECREYLVNFLNGTTDAKDECQGFYNAWKAADCQDEQDDNNLSSETKLVWYMVLDFLGLGRRRHRSENGTIVDDDVVIDDYYENWECCTSISDFYEKHCQQNHEIDAFKLLGVMAVLVVCGFMKSIIRVMKWQWIPDAGACIIVGAVFGGFLRLVHPEFVKDELIFDNDLFLQILLPPIIFEAALTIDKRAFRRDLFPILTFAILGTGFSALAIGYITYTMSHWGHGSGLPLLDSLLFGSLMSSIDPVATLSILAGVGVSQSDTLYTLIFGESLLNDGVAIVLLNSLVRHMGDAGVVGVATVHDTLKDFFIVTLGSIAIGIACGGLCNFYFWALQGQHKAVTEVAMFFTWAFIPYYIADGLGLSGIIAIMVMGFMLDYFIVGGFQSEDNDWMEYMEMRMHPSEPPREPRFHRFQQACSHAFNGSGHIHERSRHHVKFVAEVISSLMETAIFAYLGLFLFNDTSYNILFTGSALISCLTSRAVMIVIASFLINFCVWIDLEAFLGRVWYMVRRQNSRISISLEDDSLIDNEKAYLDKKTQLILFSAGIRGAVSYALVQNIPVYDSVTKHGSMYKNELRNMTSTVIVALLFSFGALTYFVVQHDAGRPNRERAAGPLTHRLMSMGLASDDDGLTSELNSLVLEEEALEPPQQPLNSRPPTSD